ncbi:MAG: beta-ketoacyl synthase chain length factor, partial [Myxococcales bacterium]|nr:beta-ketoacyl synthase chain length factor [Myxococcales bacterium]
AEPGGPVSPTKFHNSVHNTATGYLSIATGNHHSATALAGGPAAVEVALLEALAGLLEGHTGAGGSRDTLLVFAEERLPAPFERADGDPTFAVALHLSTIGDGLELELVPVEDDAAHESWAGPRERLGSTVDALLPLLRAAADFAGGRRDAQSFALVAPGERGSWRATIRERS